MPHPNKTKICGICQIRNLVNGKLYIGSSHDIKQRWAKHKVFLNKNIHHSKYLQNAWNKYSKKNFKFEILERCIPDRSILIRLEQKYINIKSEYNMSRIAGSPLGFKHTDEMKAKLSKALKGLVRTEVTKLKISKANKGKKRSVQTIKNMSERSCKPVIQISNLTNCDTQEFKSATEASLVTGINRTTISATALGKRKTAGGFIWRFKN